MQQDLVMTTEAARLLGVAADTVRAWERLGRLRAIKTGRGVRLFSRDDVQRLAAQRAGRPTAMGTPD